MDPPFNSKKKKSTPGGFSQLKTPTLKEKEIHGPGGVKSCNDLPHHFNIYLLLALPSVLLIAFPIYGTSSLVDDATSSLVDLH